MATVSSLSPVSIYGSGITQTITVSTDNIGDNISSITISKVPISSEGAGTSFAYQALTLNENDFISVDSLTFSYGGGITETSFSLFGIYTDYLFDDQSIKYYNNPNNTPIGTGSTVSKPSVKITKKVENKDANPKLNSYVNVSTGSSVVSAPNNLCNYYHQSPSWGHLDSTIGSGYTTDAIYSFTPSSKPYVEYYYTFSISYSNVNPLYGSGVSEITITQQVNYDFNEIKNRFQKALNNQRNKTKFKCDN